MEHTRDTIIVHATVVAVPSSVEIVSVWATAAHVRVEVEVCSWDTINLAYYAILPANALFARDREDVSVPIVNIRDINSLVSLRLTLKEM